MKKFKVGIQLYSLRNAMEKDMDATLRSVKGEQLSSGLSFIKKGNLK